MLGFKFGVGVLLTVNFVVFWALPIALQGMTWKFALRHVLGPVYDAIDQNSTLRWIGSTYIYSKPQHADFFAMSVIVTVWSLSWLALLFYTQLSTGYLPAWLIISYYFAWVGLGGRVMGAAYTFAHKEGHSATFYKKWIRNYIGNFFENWLGPFFGSVPHNFTTSHVVIHHRLNGAMGDTFYQWDLDRSSLHDFMLYMHRVLLHVSGLSSLKLFRTNGFDTQHAKLLKGCGIYWVVLPVAILVVTRSVRFLFFIYLEPMLCMGYFLALLNFGFHGFIEFDERGQSIQCVNSTCIIEGEDDSYGEDDHLAHHYAITVYYRDLPAWQRTQIDEWKKFKASVFRKTSPPEMGVCLLFGLWDKLANE
jgi:hypothetical protein